MTAAVLLALLAFATVWGLRQLRHEEHQREVQRRTWAHQRDALARTTTACRSPHTDQCPHSFQPASTGSGGTETTGGYP